MESIEEYPTGIGLVGPEDTSSTDSLSSYSCAAGGDTDLRHYPNASNIANSEFSDDLELSYYLDLLRPSATAARRLSEIGSDDTQSSEDRRPVNCRTRKWSKLCASPNAPDNLIIDPIDSNYLQFFFIQAPMFLLFTQHFPSAPSAIFELASQNAPTLQAILAVSSQHADMVAGRKPTRALIHLSKCLPQIQKALTSRQINEGHIAAVYCLTRLHFARRERITARNHLHGLYLMLEAYQQGGLDEAPESPLQYNIPRDPSPFMMFLWRIAIQMDLAIGNRGQELVFPSPPAGQDEFHRTWISRIASPEATEWALAEFALDDLHHHTLSLEKLAAKLRSSELYDVERDETRIQAGVKTLWEMHQHWRTREIVRKAAKVENQWRLRHPIIDDEGQFLRYGPPLRFHNEFFVRMLIYHTERIIQIDIILTPDLRKTSERRLRAAIEICRIIAGVRDMNEAKAIGQYFQGLNNAGIVFDPQQYLEGKFEWVINKLYEVDSLSGYDSGRRLIQILHETWKSDDAWLTYRRLSGRSAPS